MTDSPKGITVESDTDYHVYPKADTFTLGGNNSISIWADGKVVAVYAPGMWRAAWFTAEQESPV